MIIRIAQNGDIEYQVLTSMAHEDQTIECIALFQLHLFTEIIENRTQRLILESLITQLKTV